MNLHNLVDSLLNDTLKISLPAFWPELALCATIVLLLLVRVFPGGNRVPSVLLALGGSLIALWLASPRDGIASWAEFGRQNYSPACCGTTR